MILKSKVCPECHTVLDNTIKSRSKRYNQIDNAISFKDSIKTGNARIQEEIEKYFESEKEKVDKSQFVGALSLKIEIQQSEKFRVN